MSDFYPELSNIDGRAEFERILRGDVGVVGIGRPAIYRYLTDDHCACWDNVSGGPLAYCGYCLGEGFTFREKQELIYIADGVAPLYKPGVFGSGDYPMTQFGVVDPTKATGFCSWFMYPNYERYTFAERKQHDKLLLLKVDENGNCVYPQVVTAKYKIMNVIPRHGDRGKVEYVELALEKELVV